jgi:hypothetical protein
MSACRVTAGRLLVTFFMVVRRLTMVMRRCLMMRSSFIVRQATQPSDLCHMLPIPAYGFAAPATCLCMALRVAEPTPAFTTAIIIVVS